MAAESPLAPALSHKGTRGSYVGASPPDLLPSLLLGREGRAEGAQRFNLRRSKLAAAFACALAWTSGQTATAAPPDYQEIFGEVELEATGFLEDPAFAGQDRHSGSVAATATLLLEWDDGETVFRFTPFVRLDSADEARTHFDIRELKIDRLAGDWSFTVGADSVFWGKTEAVHLVDIINQTDQVEDLDDEDRLGQPLIRVGYLADIGEFSGFLMPYFRERTLPGKSGRLRSDPAVATGRPIYQTSAEEWTPSAAVRFAGVFNDFDLGLSAFYGLGRDPAFFFDGRELRPFYELIGQIGFDGQYTSGATLWKLEAIGRFDQKNARFRDEDFAAATGGLEHTLFGVADSNADLGLILEYAVDSRLGDASTVFQNDVILGVRLALNDAADQTALFTGAVDAESAETVLRLEAERRLGEGFSLQVEGQGFLNTDRNGIAASLEDDSFLRVKLTYFFGGY